MQSIHGKKVLVTSVAFFLECLQFEQSLVEKLHCFVKLVSPFRSLYKSTGVVCCFFDLTTLSLEEFLSCIVCGRNTRNVGR